MALLVEYGETNREESTAIVTRYTRTLKSQDVTAKVPSYQGSSETVDHAVSVGWYEYHRLTSGSYRYVGMTKAAALACAEELRAVLEHAGISQKVKSGDGIVMIEDGGELSILAGDVNVTREAGSMWQVNVNLNEDVVLYSTARYATQAAIQSFFNSKVSSNNWEYRLP